MRRQNSRLNLIRTYAFLPFLSFPRRRESSIWPFFNALDSRFHGNDTDCVSPNSNKNSFCIKQILLVKIASDFEPPPRRKISARQRAKNSEFVWKNGGKSVGRASRVPPSGFEKAVEFCFGVFIVPSSNLFSKQSEVMMSHASRAW